jgi:protein TonB
MRHTKHPLPAAPQATRRNKYYRLVISCCVVLLSITAHAQQVVAAPDTTDMDIVFTKVEQEARFPGGIAAWQRYLQRNLDGSAPIKDNAKPGMYTVRVQFTVSKNGSISNVKAIEAPADCPSCIASAIKVIQRGPRWVPAVQRGRNVNYQHVQAISFLRQ